MAIDTAAIGSLRTRFTLPFTRVCPKAVDGERTFFFNCTHAASVHTKEILGIAAILCLFTDSHVRHAPDLEVGCLTHRLARSDKARVIFATAVIVLVTFTQGRDANYACSK